MFKKHKKTLLTTVFLLVLGIFSGIFYAFPAATQLDEDIETLENQLENKRDKVEKIEQSIQEYKEKAREKRKEAVSLSNQVEIIENRKKQIELEINKIENEIDSLNIKLKSLNRDIKEKETDISRQKDMMAEFIKTIHQKNDNNYLEVVAAYDNFSDFYDRLQYLQSVEQDLAKSAEALKVVKAKLESDKKQKEKIKKSFEEKRDKLEQKQTDLEEQEKYKQRILAQTQQSELKYKTLVSNLRSQYQQIENEITSIESSVRKKLEKQEKLEKQIEGDSTKLSWPTQSRYVTAYFQDPEYPYKHIMEHNAIDIRASFRTPIKAAASGYVARAKRCNTASCYAFVMIVHDKGISTVYGHLNKINVQENQFVTRGETIGLSGAAPGTIGAGPWTTGAHLHLEVRKNGIPKDPLNYLVEDY